MTPAQIAVAKDLCASCPVFDRCHDEHIVKRVELYGVFAGFLPREARRWRAQHDVTVPPQRRPHGTRGGAVKCAEGQNGSQCQLCRPVFLRLQATNKANSQDRGNKT